MVRTIPSFSALHDKKLSMDVIPFLMLFSEC